MTNTRRRLLTAIAILAAAGIGISSVSLYHHYERSESSFCNINQTFNCDIVNHSSYSTLLGIPVALIGILGYAALLGASIFRRNNPETPKVLLAVSLVGLTFALYLTYVEGYVLAAWCVLCLSSLAIIATIAGLSATLAAQKHEYGIK